MDDSALRRQAGKVAATADGIAAPRAGTSRALALCRIAKSRLARGPMFVCAGRMDDNRTSALRPEAALDDRSAGTAAAGKE